MSPRAYHIFTKPGDARAELDGVLRDLGTPPERAGYHKSIYVSRANQTVVFCTGSDTALARELRTRRGWREPEP